MKTIIWSNGQVDRAPTWKAMLDRIRAAQWHDLDEDEFRAEMGKRAWRWSGVSIDFGATPARFFAELERAKLIVIEREPEGEK